MRYARNSKKKKNNKKMLLKCYKVILVIHENYATKSMRATNTRNERNKKIKVTNWDTIGM